MTAAADALLEALSRVNWKSAIDDDHAETWGKLASLAPDADVDPAGFNALRALAEVSGMMLRPDHWDKPYERLYDFSGRRSYLPESFTPTALELFERLLPQVESPWLAARLCDVLFIRADKSEKYAKAQRAAEKLAAVGLSSPVTVDEAEHWRRAAEIAVRFKLAGIIAFLSESAIAAVRAVGDSSVIPFLSHLWTSGLCRDRAEEVAEALAGIAADEPLLHLRREILNNVRRWTTDRQAASAVVESIGDSWWDEALARSDSALVARSFLGNAYNTYNSIPRRYRSAQTTQRLGELPKLMREAGEASLDEMRPVRIRQPDLTSLQEWTESLQEIDDSVRALGEWLTLAPLEHFSEAVESATYAVKQSTFVANLSMTTLADDGRKVHSTSFKERLGLDEKTWEQMFRAYESGISITVRGVIGPGLANFSTHLPLTLTDFEMFCAASPFIPDPQKVLFATALHHGYYGRFAESLFMLAPLIESCVRSALHSIGAETRTIRLDDTEIEPGLSALMDMDEAEEAIHPDIGWNVRALFCGPLGPNLRNRVAHGLLSTSASDSEASVFAWWFAFRLAFAPFYNIVKEYPAGRGPSTPLT